MLTFLFCFLGQPQKKGNSEQNIGEEVRLSDSAGVYRAGNIIWHIHALLLHNFFITGFIHLYTCELPSAAGTLGRPESRTGNTQFSLDAYWTFQKKVRKMQKNKNKSSASIWLLAMQTGPCFNVPVLSESGVTLPYSRARARGCTKCPHTHAVHA